MMMNHDNDDDDDNDYDYDAGSNDDDDDLYPRSKALKSGLPESCC